MEVQVISKCFRESLGIKLTRVDVWLGKVNGAQHDLIDVDWAITLQTNQLLADSEGPDQTSLMCRQIWAFTVRQGLKMLHDAADIYIFMRISGCKGTGFAFA